MVPVGVASSNPLWSCQIGLPLPCVIVTLSLTPGLAQKFLFACSHQPSHSPPVAAFSTQLKERVGVETTGAVIISVLRWCEHVE